jgi:hypothetical protein
LRFAKDLRKIGEFARILVSRRFLRSEPIWRMSRPANNMNENEQSVRARKRRGGSTLTRSSL